MNGTRHRTDPGLATATPLVELRRVSKRFVKALDVSARIGNLLGAGVNEEVVRAVDGVDLAILAGEVVGLVGESGCGKSTLGRLAVGLLPLSAGERYWSGTPLAGLSRAAARAQQLKMQMIFQDPYASLDPRMTAGSIIAEPLDIHGIGTKKERQDRIRELLPLVGLDAAHGVRYPHEFSGGQRQRIGVARALALDPDLIVADEPISALDVSIQAQILNLLQRLQGRLGLTYLFIAHDLAVVRHISDRIAVMYLGQIVEVASSRDLNTRPLHPYSVALLSAVPVPDPGIEKRRKRIILRGDVPSPAAPPSGCRFHTRCWLRERLGNPERCSAEEPVLRELESGHAVACHFAEDVAGSVEQALVTGRPTAASTSVAGAPSGAGTASAPPTATGPAVPGE